VNVGNCAGEPEAVISSPRCGGIAIRRRQFSISHLVRKPVSYAVARCGSTAVSALPRHGWRRHGLGIGGTTAREDDDLRKNNGYELTSNGNLRPGEISGW
jgi:hypothetical protein